MRSTRTSAAWAAMAMTTSLLAVIIVGAQPHAASESGIALDGVDASQSRDLTMASTPARLTAPAPDAGASLAAGASHMVAVVSRP